MSINFREHSNKQSNLKSELNSLFKSLKSEKNTKFGFWEELVGEKIAKVAVPVSNKKGVLFVKVEDPVWRFELTREKNELLTKLNETFKKNSIKDIVFI